MRSIERGLRPDSTLEDATSSFQTLLRLALWSASWTEWEVHGNTMLRNRRREVGRMIPATFVWLAWPKDHDSESPGPVVTLATAPGKARSEVVINHTLFAPYSRDSPPRVNQCWFHIGLRSETYDVPEVQTRHLTREELAAFEPYGGPVYSVRLAQDERVHSSYLIIDGRKDQMSLNYQDYYRPEDNNSGFLGADEDVPRLVGLNNILHRALVEDGLFTKADS